LGNYIDISRGCSVVDPLFSGNYAKVGWTGDCDYFLSADDKPAFFYSPAIQSPEQVKTFDISFNHLIDLNTSISN